MRVQEVKYISDYTISVLFDDGVSGIVQLNDLVQKGIFKVLQDKEQFSKVFTNGYSIAWPNDLEIDAATIYSEISGKSVKDFFSPNYQHASNL